MTPRLTILLFLATFSSSPSETPESADTVFSAPALMKHIEFLAGSELEGRAAGTRFERMAADYIAGQLEEHGVKPLPSGERLQDFEYGTGSNAARSLNVFGWIPGMESEEEVVVLGAHMDHLGVGFAGVHPGADDNASGVAVALEIAGALQTRRDQLKRSVLVVFFGGEEQGLRGSRHFVQSGPIENARVVAMVNLDMVGRALADQVVLGPLKKLMKIDDRNSIGVVGARGRPFFASVVDAACADAGLVVFGTKNIPFISAIVESFAKNRSDHAPFESVGIPTLFFGSGESDDYHRPSDTIEKLLPELMARRARVIHDTVVALSTAPAERLPPRENAILPAGQKVATLELARGDLKVLIRDNSQSPGVLSGVQSLMNVRDAALFDAYDPEAAGASAGLNFEHIISGHRLRSNRFTPRQGKYDLYRLNDGNSAMLVRMREDSPWDVSSTLCYTVAAPNAIDFEFQCTPHSRLLFGRRGYAIFFFANYMNDVTDTRIHFLGVERDGGEEQWIAADVPPGHADWNRGGTYRHRDAAPLECDDDHNFRLNSWSYDEPRFTKPSYYGRAANDMVAILMFDRGHTSQDEIRFSVFKFKLPKKPRPAWDFQYVVRSIEEGANYGFRGRLVWKKWISRENCLEEYESWARTR